jgi:sirohydrochlorin cobaltochelatase
VGVHAKEFPDATLLLIGHGSTVNGDSGATVYQHAAELRRRGVFAGVGEAFFKREPRIGPALAAIRTPRVFVVPLFVSEGYFTRQAIPCELGLPPGAQNVMPCTVQMSGRTVVYCPPVGTHPLLTEIILARANAALTDCSLTPPASRITHHVSRLLPPSILHPPSSILDPPALVLAGHGTALDAQSRRSVEHQVALIAARRCFAEVHPAFLEEAPRIADIPSFVQALHLVVVPFFMSDGLHVCEDIPILLGESAAVVQQRLCAGQWPWLNPTQRAGKTIFYTPSVGAAPAMAEIILDRVRAAALPSK